MVAGYPIKCHKRGHHIYGGCTMVVYDHLPMILHGTLNLTMSLKLISTRFKDEEKELLEYFGIISSQDSFDLFDSQIDPNTIYYL